MIIKNIRVIDPGSGYDDLADIYIANGKIADIKAHATDDGPEYFGGKPEEQIIDGTGLIAAPGLVDVHVHFRDPGLTYKEDIMSGARSAVKGGYTTVVMMANTKPPVDNPDTLEYVLSRAEEVSAQIPLNILAAAAVTKGLKGQELTDSEALIAGGAASLTDDGIPVMDTALLREAFVKAAGLKVPVSLHEENPEYISENGINAGEAAKKLGLIGSPRIAEISMIKRDLPIALETGVDVNIQHISTKEGVALVREARQRQLAQKGECHIHAEATPHHFSLTEDAVLEYGTLAKMNPPLRTQEDRLAIIEGLKDGTIEIIATDHAPHSIEEKKRDLTAAPSGIIGLETALPLGIMNLVDAGHLSLSELIDRMSTGPAKLYGLENGISIGRRADIVIFDPDEEWTVSDFASKSCNSPFLGAVLKGKVRYTICGGRIAYSDREQ